MTGWTPSAFATATASETAPGLTATPAALGAALERLRGAEAVSLPILSAAARRSLRAAAAGLPYRAATPVVGEGARRVHQDFELTVAFTPGDPFERLAAAFGDLVARAAARLTPNPLSGGFVFNDLILQRYPAGAGGITPHRDHLKYRELVALISLAGQGRFTLSADRAGAGAREVPLAPGSALLMVAPGFAGGSRRPFHALADITQERYSLGLRYAAQG